MMKCRMVLPTYEAHPWRIVEQKQANKEKIGINEDIKVKLDDDQLQAVGEWFNVGNVEEAFMMIPNAAASGTTIQDEEGFAYA